MRKEIESMLEEINIRLRSAGILDGGTKLTVSAYKPATDILYRLELIYEPDGRVTDTFTGFVKYKTIKEVLRALVKLSRIISAKT